MRSAAFLVGLIILIGCTSDSATGVTSSGTTPDNSDEPGRSTSVLPASADACRWTVVPTPNASPSRLQNRLSAISADRPDDVWAVGTANRGIEGGQSYPLLMHWDGRRWTLVPSAPTATNAFLQGVATVSASDAWAVGFAGHRSLVEHWNGAYWSSVPVPLPNGAASALNAVSAISADDVWAVGNTGVGANDDTVIEHWNGHRWRLVSSPNASPPVFRSAPDNSLVSVAGDSKQDVVSVGTTRDGGSVYHADPLIEHWNGAMWTIASGVPSSSLGRTFLESVTVASSSDAWAVGATSSVAGTGASTTGGGQIPFIEHWDGTSWAPEDLPQVRHGVLFGVTATSENEAWAVGSEMGPTRPLIGQQTDGVWKSVVAPSPPRSLLSGVDTASDGTIWAVGSSGSTQRTLAMRCVPR